MDGLGHALDLLPLEWKQAMGSFLHDIPEEFRLRVGRKPTVLLADGERSISDEIVSEERLLRVMEKATGASIHTAAPELAEGYLSYRGLRIGVCGFASMKGDLLTSFRHVSSLAIRVPREFRGICDQIMNVFLREGFQNTLVIGKPGEGKTTVLRELVRSLSERGYRIGVSDERNELAAMDGGTAQFDLGRCSDVMTGLPKTRGAMMLLRGFNPQIIAMDEISREKDLEAVRQIVGCGVGILASVHGADLSELKKRPAYRSMLEEGVFHYLLRVDRMGQVRRYALERIGS